MQDQSPPRLHIVHVITNLLQGGAEAMLEKLIHEARLADPGVTHEVVSLRSLGDVGPRLVAAGVKVRVLGLGRSPVALLGLGRLASWLRAAGPNVVVQTWMYHGDLLGGLAARLAGRRRVVWNVRQTGLDLRDIGRATRAVVRLCGLASRWLPTRIVTNAHAAIAAHAALGYDTKRFLVIPNGFDPAVFARKPEARQALRDAWGLADHELAIGMVARLDPQKDFGNFVAAAAIVARDLPAARFVLVGKGVPGDAPLSTLISDAGLAGRFILEDKRGDIPSVMNALDIFCLSSRKEGFPNVLGEAMACETPSATTDAGDARSVIGDDSLVARTEDPAALAQCILRIGRLPEPARREMGRLQRARIVERFSIARIWQQYHSLYQQL